MVALQKEAENIIFDTGANANYFIGGVVHADSNADNVTIYSDGNSNSKLTLTDFGAMEINILAKDSTNWLIWGYTERCRCTCICRSIIINFN